MHVRRLIVDGQLAERQPGALFHFEAGAEADLRFKSEMAHVGAYVIRVILRLRKLIVGIGVQMQQRVRAPGGEPCKYVEQARQQLARLIATVGERQEFTLRADPSLGLLAVRWRTEDVQINAVRDVLARNPALIRNPLPVAAHRNRNIHLAQQFGPTGRKSLFSCGAVNWEVEHPGSVCQFHLPAYVRSSEERQPPYVGQSDDGVRAMANEEGEERIAAHWVIARRVDFAAVPLERLAR